MNAAIPTKAQTLRQALNLFDPEEPLHTREELEHFSVERANSPIDEIQLLHNLSVLQYQNDDVWYDVHPIVLPLIEADDASA